VWRVPDEDAVGPGLPLGDGVAPPPARLGTVLLGTVLLGTVLLGTAPGVADPEPGIGGAE
jgi:hypothetical protein